MFICKFFYSAWKMLLYFAASQYYFFVALNYFVFFFSDLALDLYLSWHIWTNPYIFLQTFTETKTAARHPFPVPSPTTRSSVSRPAPGSSSTPATPSSSGKVKSRSRSKSPFRSFRWKAAKRLIAESHHSDDEGTRGSRLFSGWRLYCKMSQTQQRRHF